MLKAGSAQVKGDVLYKAKRAICFLGIAYFLSGAASLIAEVIWVRLLKLSLGNTVVASGITVSVFLGGLALGAALAGKWADRLRAPLRVYAILECAIAVLVLTSPWTFGLADSLYRTIHTVAQPSQPVLLAVQVTVSALLLLIPTTLMGATLPVLGAFVTHGATHQAKPSNAGRSVGGLYAVYTLGAATGCFLAGFILIRVFGVRGTLGWAAGLNLAAGLGSFLTHIQMKSTRPAHQPEAYAQPQDEPERTPHGRTWHGVLLGCAFTSGFVGLAYEVLWIRGLTVFVPARTYVFSAVLCIYLLGAMIGAAIAGRLADWSRAHPSVLGFILTLLGAAGILYVPMLSTASALHDRMAYPLADWLDLSLGLAYEMTYPLILSLVFFLLPSIVIGMSFPTVLGIWRAENGCVGRVTGHVYAAGTFGSVAGGLAAAFLLIPGLGLQASLKIVGTAAALAGIVAPAVYRGRLRFPFAALPVIVLMSAWFVPGDLFERFIETRLKDRYNAVEVLHVDEGVTTIVTVHTQTNTYWTVPLGNGTFVQRSFPSPEPTRHIAVSGLHIAADEAGQSAWQKFHGHSAMLLHADPRRVLCIGYGTGESVACASRHNPEVLECVEISPEVVNAALKYFSHINLGEAQDELVRVIIADGRNYLHLSDARYDVILCDPINPVIAENGSLYSLEFFLNVREHLNPDGLFLCWLPLHLPRDILESILATLMEVYPHVTAWTLPISGGTFVQLIASVSEQTFAPLEIEKRLHPVRADMAAIAMPSSCHFLAYYRGDEKDIATCLRNPVLNTDNRPIVEFSSRRASMKKTGAFILELLGCAREDSLMDHIDWQDLPEMARHVWRRKTQQIRAGIIP